MPLLSLLLKLHLHEDLLLLLLESELLLPFSSNNVWVICLLGQHIIGVLGKVEVVVVTQQGVMVVRGVEVAAVAVAVAVAFAVEVAAATAAADIIVVALLLFHRR